MGLSFPTGTRNAIAAAIAARTDADAGAATIKVYTGVKPSPDAAPTGTLLLTFTLDTVAFSASTTPLSLANLPKSASGVANGLAGWFRMSDESGDSVLDGTCGTTGSGEDIELSTLSITTGLVVNLTAGTINVPAS